MALITSADSEVIEVTVQADSESVLPLPGYGPFTRCHTEALRLLRLGYTPLPIDPGSKKPWLNAWSEFQTRQPTEDEIYAWYAERPSAGVGIVTTGLLIIDIDGPTNPWPADADRCMSLSPAPCVQTPGGGRHLYFKAPPGHQWRNWNSQLALKVDIKVDAGFLVVPPTARPGGRAYEWQGDNWLGCGPGFLPSPPQWLEDDLNALLKTRPSVYQSKPLAGPLAPGERNEVYYRHACLMRDTGADESLIFATLAMHNEMTGTGLQHDELERISRSAVKHEPTARVGRGGLVASNEQLSVSEQIRHVRAISLAELEDRPVPTWLVQNVIPDHSLGLFVGVPGGGKSFFLLGLTFAVACGRPLLGSGPVPNRTGWVLLLLAEGSGSWAIRSKAYRSYYSVEQTDQVSVIIEGVDFASAQSIHRLQELVSSEIERRDGVKPALIVLDTLSAAIPGMDENLQATMSPVTSALQKWVSAGIPVIVAHHPAKSGNGYRGSSVLLGSCDWMISLRQSGKLRHLVADKLRDADKIANCAFEIVDHNGVGVPVKVEDSSAIVPPTNPGLMAALRKHGWNDPGDEPRDGALQHGGVTLEAVLTSWRASIPIMPASTHDKAGYNKALNARLTVLINWVLAAEIAGSIEVTSGCVSGKSSTSRTASKKAMIKQFGNDESQIAST